MPCSRSKLRISATFRNPERFVIRRERLSKINGPIIVESFLPAREETRRKCNFFRHRVINWHGIRHSTFATRASPRARVLYSHT